MQSLSAKSSEVAILESNVEEGLRERFFLNKFLFVYYIISFFTCPIGASSFVYLSVYGK